MARKSQQSDEFLEAIHAMRAASLADQRATREHRRQVPEDFVLRGPEAALGERRLPPNKRCPACQRVKLSPRSWVVSGLVPGEPCCRSCAFRALHGRPPRQVLLVGSSQADLACCREPLATQEYFADLCGWTQARQSHLEGSVALGRVRGATVLRLCLAFVALEAEAEEVPVFLRTLFRYMRLMVESSSSKGETRG